MWSLINNVHFLEHDKGAKGLKIEMVCTFESEASERNTTDRDQLSAVCVLKLTPRTDYTTKGQTQRTISTGDNLPTQRATMRTATVEHGHAHNKNALTFFVKSLNVLNWIN